LRSGCAISGITYSVTEFALKLKSRFKVYASVIIVFIVNFVKIFDVDIIAIEFNVITDYSSHEYGS